MKANNKKIVILLGFIIFIYIGYTFVSNRDTIMKNISGEGDKIRNTLIVKNYRMEHNIKIKDEYGKTKEDILLKSDTYGKKILTQKIVSNITTEYYEDGKNLYKKENDKYEIYNENIIENIDLKLLDLDYVSALIGSAKEESRTINTLTLYNKIDNIRIILTYDMNKDLDTFTIEKDNYVIKSKLYDIDLVEDFDPLK